MLDQLQLREIVLQDPRYKIDAYYFILETLDFARTHLRMGRAVKERAPSVWEEEADEPEDGTSHISGADWCEALRIRSQWMFGFMAKTVLNQWGIHTTDDVGRIVYNMVDHHKIRVAAEDRPEDFHAVYDFQEAFCDEFCIAKEEYFAEEE